MAAAYAVRITRVNKQVIRSEQPKFNNEEFERWIEDHGEEGYFLRDEETPLDCGYFAEPVFFQMYMFKSNDTAALFREVRHK